MNIHFQKATLPYKSTVMSWLTKPHVQEFWDNSPEHKKDIEIFMLGRTELSPYWNGLFDYWLGFINDEPYCLLMTSEAIPVADLPPEWVSHLSKKGKTFTLDFMIGNEKYLGKGLGATTLIQFMKYFATQIEPKTDVFIIDPAADNPKAKHVYQKAGFKVVAEFAQDTGPEYALLGAHYLMIKQAPF